jgi:hypothetical protein
VPSAPGAASVRGWHRMSRGGLRRLDVDPSVAAVPPPWRAKARRARGAIAHCVHSWGVSFKTAEDRSRRACSALTALWSRFAAVTSAAQVAGVARDRKFILAEQNLSCKALMAVRRVGNPPGAVSTTLTSERVALGIARGIIVAREK